MADQFTTKHGQAEQGPTAGRVAAYGGQVYYDTEANCPLYYDSVLEEWRPDGMPSYANTAAAPSNLTAIEGATMYDKSQGEPTYSDGVVWLDQDTDEESSSTSSSSSST